MLGSQTIAQWFSMIHKEALSRKCFRINKNLRQSKRTLGQNWEALVRMAILYSLRGSTQITMSSTNRDSRSNMPIFWTLRRLKELKREPKEPGSQSKRSLLSSQLMSCQTKLILQISNKSKTKNLVLRTLKSWPLYLPASNQKSVAMNPLKALKRRESTIWNVESWQRKPMATAR